MRTKKYSWDTENSSWKDNSGQELLSQKKTRAAAASLFLGKSLRGEMPPSSDQTKLRRAFVLSVSALTLGVCLALAPSVTHADCVQDTTGDWTCSGDTTLTFVVGVTEGQNVEISRDATVTKSGGNLIQINPDGGNNLDGGKTTRVVLRHGASLHQTATNVAFGEPIYIRPWVDNVEIYLQSGSKIIHDGRNRSNHAINTDTSGGNITVVIEKGAHIQTNGGGFFGVDNANGTHGGGGPQGFVYIENHGTIERLGVDGVYKSTYFLSARDGTFFVNTGTVTNNVDINTANHIRDEYESSVIYIPRGHGISGEQESRVVNSGTIENFGEGWAVTGVENTTLHVVNSGRIATAGDVAISFGQGQDHLTLLEGSVLIGNVNYGNPERSFVNFGPGLSAAVQIDQSADASALTVRSPNHAHVVKNNTVYAADLTDHAARSRIQSWILGAIEDATATRNRQGTGGWATGFAARMSNDGENRYAAFEGTMGGLVVGSDLDNEMRLFGGPLVTTTETSNGSAFETDSHGGLVGVSAGVPGYGVNFSLAAGGLYNDTTRQVADNAIRNDGLDESSASYWSVFASPAVRVGGDMIGLPDATFGFRYGAFWHQDHDYDFAESSADLSVDSGFSQLVEMSASYDFVMPGNFTITPGVAATWIDGGTLDMMLAGAPVSADVPGDDWVGRGFVNVQSPDGFAANFSVLATSSYDLVYGGGLSFKF